MTQGKVLVVEDDEIWRERIFKRTLEAEGYEVLAIREYEALEEHLSPGAFDVVVVDIGLSEKDYQNIDGMKIIADIAQLDPHIPIIIVSGRAAEGIKLDAPEFHRPRAFFEKETFDKKKFLKTIEGALGKKPFPE